MTTKNEKQTTQAGVKELPKYMVLQHKHTPHAMIQIVPGELSTIMGHNTNPVMHGILGIRSNEASNNISECDTLFITEDSECFRQLGQAFIEAANHLANILNEQNNVVDMNQTELEEVTNE